MAYSFYETRLLGIMVVVFIERNNQSKITNTTTMIPCRHVSWKKLATFHDSLIYL